MRILSLIIVLLSSIVLRAQTPLPLNGMNYTPGYPSTHYPSLSNSNSLDKKWSLNKYVGISASYGFFNGGSASVFSAPIGLQLNRRLNNNLFAFAGVSAAPAYVNFNRSMISSDIYKNNPGTMRFNTNSFSMYSKFEAGLMYISDDRTFSISGSIGIYHSSNPAYPAYNMTNLQKQQPVSGSRQ
jgi:hypothetical protein